MIPPEAIPAVRRSLVRRAAPWVAGVSLAAFLAEAVRVTLLSNRHTVIPGKVYRSAQPSGDDVREYARERGVKTIVNLRGLSPEFEWYKDEARAAHELGLSQEDITLSANSLPPPNELKRAVEVLDRCEYPILIHCKAGADRTGLISALALLLFTDATLGEARQQLLPRYGHFRFGRTASMDKFFDQYEHYLLSQKSEHTRENFREWIAHHYCPGPARSHLTWAEAFPESIRVGEPRGFRLRAENRSNIPWELKPGTFASVHASYALYDSDGKDVLSSRAGLRFETVPVGGSTEILIPLPGLQAGTYKLVVELHDSTGGGIPFLTNSFVKFGDDSLVTELVVK
jgi:protein tyrosine/serine phosphatase